MDEILPQVEFPRVAGRSLSVRRLQFFSLRFTFIEVKKPMPKILLVEDDPMISEVYERKFASAGFDARVAASGKAVLEILRTESFDVVLLDIVLPEMSGMEILEHLRDPKNGYPADIKIVMFSNLNEKDDQEKALALGANGFIPKTEFSPSQLVEEISRFLRQFEAERGDVAVSRPADGVVPTADPA